MLHHDERRRLEALAERMWHDDPNFASAMDRGVPRSPVEYRRQRRRIPALTALAAAGPVLLGYPVLGFFAAWVCAVVAILWYADALDRPPRRGRGG
ncbi:DUF3040 domain-containing protein [Phytohabitans kaempferiae]|uniref:DUF3040 domain-containing protein n=1 Tax=Phytohabitans kaempferiae TaxID=1620943 RepID=A0ABV6MAG9_9ACTN